MTLTPEEIQAQNRKFTLTRESLKPLPEPHLTGMKLEGNIVLGDFVFNTIDSYGVTWVVTDIDGWFRHPNAEVNDIPRGFGDGSYDVQGRYTARSFTLSGSILTPDPSLLEEARDRLTSATNLVYRGAWLKTGTNPTRSSFVRLVGSVEIETVSARGRTNFSIPLRASDPIKYGWNDANPDGYFIEEFEAKNVSIEGSGSLSLENIGNYPVPVLFELSGPFIGPGTIFNKTTEQLIVVTGSLEGASSAIIENKQLSFDEQIFTDIATITTRSAHNILAGSQINISGVDNIFDGNYIVRSVPTNTTLTYEKIPTNSDIYSVTHKALQPGTATLDVSVNHDLSVGDVINVYDVDSLFNGQYTVTSVPTERKVSYSKTRTPPVQITGAVLVSNTATLNTSVPHQFIIGDDVIVENVTNYNGTFKIVSIPSSSQFSYSLTRTNARSITEIQMGEIAPFIGRISIRATTDQPHGFVLGERVSISNIDLTYDGTYTISEIPSTTTFIVEKDRSTVRTVSNASRFSNTVAITTSSEHGIIVGEKIQVINVGNSISDLSVNGTYTTNGAPGGSTITYQNSGTNIPSTNVFSGKIQPKSRRVSSRSLQGNIVSITTRNPHGAFVGETVVVSGMDQGVFNGTYIITSVTTDNTFTYNKTSANVNSLDIFESTPNAFIELTGSIPSKSVTGSVTVSGSLPFTSVFGSAKVGSIVDRTQSPGFIVKKNEIQFTPGVIGGVVTKDADILEIETKDREVAFNGETLGARGRIDILADFIQLAPGNNILEFEDSGAPESTSLIRVYYRPGWLS